MAGRRPAADWARGGTPWRLNAVGCEVAWRWTAEGRTLRGWVNGVQTRGGGSHADALRSRLEAKANGRGWVAAVHVEMPHPRFEAPIKDTLCAPEVAAFVEAAFDLGCASAE